MKDRVNLMIKSILIEYHWYLIMRFRKKGNRLLNAGEPLTSEKLIRLSAQITMHGIKAMQYQAYYESKIGLRT